ncbi:MAG: hypothetical protein FP816_17340 [Desulfobacteraceae bacterium]|nr:hypothetical protein [Desulfobacteraceae bacterium]
MQSYVDEAKQELSKAISDEGLSDTQRVKMVERSAKTLKEYGQSGAFPGKEIPLKANREKNYRRVQAEVIYANDLRAILHNMLMSQQLSMINAMQIEVVEDQIKLMIPGEGVFELSKDLVGTVFNWDIKEGFSGGKQSDAKELVQKFRDLATTKEFVKDVEKLYTLQRELLLKRYQELKKTEDLQAQLGKTYRNAANSASVLKDFQKAGGDSEPNPVSSGSNSGGGSHFKASLPGDWMVDQDKPGQWIASSKREIIAKSANCPASNLNVKVTATFGSSAGSLSSGDVDKELRGWMAGSGWYPEEASIESLSIPGFTGRLLSTTLKYKDGYGGAMSGYKPGTAHIHGYAILGENGGSRTIKVSYSVFAACCWDNKAADTSKTAAQSGKNEALQVLRSLGLSGTKSTGNGNSGGMTSQENIVPPAKSSAYADPKNLTDSNLREELLRELIKKASTPEEAKYWTEREKEIKKKPAQPQPKPQPQTQPQPEKNKPAIAVKGISVNELVGDWDFVANGFAAKMEIRSTGSALEGRIFFNVFRKWEPLEALAFDASTGKFTFFRPNGKQQFEGTLVGSTLTGTYNKTSTWTAKKSGTVSK